MCSIRIETRSLGLVPVGDVPDRQLLASDGSAPFLAIIPTGTAPRSFCLQDGPGGRRVERPRRPTFRQQALRSAIADLINLSANAAPTSSVHFARRRRSETQTPIRRSAVTSGQAKLRLRTRSADALLCESTSSVTTLKRASSVAPKLVEIATSAASRP
jgi:hypothetical protein